MEIHGEQIKAKDTTTAEGATGIAPSHLPVRVVGGLLGLFPRHGGDTDRALDRLQEEREMILASGVRGAAKGPSTRDRGGLLEPLRPALSTQATG